MKEKNKDQGGLSPEKLKEIELSHMKMIEKQMATWEAFPEWKKITDEAIRYILMRWDSKASDEARSAILRLYSYETPLYGALNKANQRTDKRAIQTLGPFSHLLY